MTRRRSKKKQNKSYSFVTLEPKSSNQNLYVNSIEKNDITLVEIEEAEVKNISKEFFKSKFGITL